MGAAVGGAVRAALQRVALVACAGFRARRFAQRNVCQGARLLPCKQLDRLRVLHKCWMHIVEGVWGTCCGWR